MNKTRASLTLTTNNKSIGLLLGGCLTVVQIVRLRSQCPIALSVTTVNAYALDGEPYNSYILIHSVLLFDALLAHVRFDGLSSLQLVPELGRTACMLHHSGSCETPGVHGEGVVVDSLVYWPSCRSVSCADVKQSAVVAKVEDRLLRLGFASHDPQPNEEC
eukprot:2979418-Amphidinium_carterae.1